MSGRKVCSLRDGETIHVTWEGLERVIRDVFDACDAAGRGVPHCFDPLISERTCHMVDGYCDVCGKPDPSSGDAAFCAHCGARVVSE